MTREIDKLLAAAKAIWLECGETEIGNLHRAITEFELARANEKTQLEFVLRAFRIFDDFDGPSNDCLEWRTDGEYAPFTLMVNTSDLFAWGYANSDRLTPDNIEALQQAKADIEKASPKGTSRHAHLLWACRASKLRPQVAYYKYFEDWEKPLFDACGPVETQYGAAIEAPDPYDFENAGLRKEP